MAGAEWIWPAAVLAIVALVLAFVWLDLRDVARSRVSRLVRCPLRHRQAAVDFCTDPFDREHYRDVLACSLLPEGSVDCPMACLRLTPDEIAGHELDAACLAARRLPFGVPPPQLSELGADRRE